MLVYDRQSYGAYGLTPVLELPTPGSVQTRADLINSTVEGINKDVARAATPDTSAQWQTFYAAWHDFYTKLTASSTAWLWTSTSDALDQYEAQANGWRDTLASAGVKITGPAISPLGAIPIKTIVYGAVALGSLFVAGKLLDFLPKRK